MRFIKLLTVCLLFFTAFTPSVFAQETQTPLVMPTKEDYLKAKVLEIKSEGTKEIVGKNYPYQILQIRFLDGQNAGREMELEQGQKYSITTEQKVKAGDTIVLVKLTVPVAGQEHIDYQIIDKYRLPQIYALLVAFLLVVVAIAKWKGLGSVLGLAVSLLVIVKFIVPQLLAGKDPLLTTIAGSAFILITTIYLAHGLSKKTTIALVASMASLALVGILAIAFTNFSKLSGLGSEDAGSLRFGQTSAINLRGLFLGSIIIGALGVLDDITTGLAASIFEIKSADPKTKLKELMARGMNVGREHIASLVNTLVLAYAGASLPLFIFIVLNPSSQPMWYILNSEVIIEEVVRTLAGSLGLIAAVPITAFLAAYTATKLKTQ